MSFRHQLRAPEISEKTTDDFAVNKTPQSVVMCIYHTHIAGYWRNVTVCWCKNLMNHSLDLIVNSLEGEINYSYKIDMKPWLFWSKKGNKSFELEGCQVDIYWDFRSAKFSGSPEPLGDYYVAVVSDEEVVLLVGDNKKKAYKRTKARRALVDAILFVKKENVFAKKSFSTRCKLDGRKQEHDIVVESSTMGPRHPELWISIDGIAVVHVSNLQWKFRGNQTVIVNCQPVQVFWDVHDWIFHTPGTGHGLFIFKPGSPEPEEDGSGHWTSSDTSDGSKYFWTRSLGANRNFCLFLYAKKME